MRRLRHIFNSIWMVLIALLGMLLLGYHPDAEDGGIYSAAIEARLDPSLFPHDRTWVTAHTRFALFVPSTAILTRALHLPLTTILFLLHIAGLLAVFAAAAHLARTCVPTERRPWLATLTTAVGAGLPVAGTALYAVDPYCTARTLSSPLLLFALSFALRNRWAACTLCWTVAASMHPLMALWGALPILLTAALATRHPRRWTAALMVFSFAAALLLSAASSPETAGSRAVALTRAYWFPSRWHWYEWAGAVAPCLLLFGIQRLRDCSWDPPLTRMAAIASATTGIAAVLAICFAREAATSLTVARLQPLRSLHLIFLAFLAVGGAVIQARMRSSAQRVLAVIACAVLAASVFGMQRSLFEHTPHLEWPGLAPANNWQKAFAWCRDNTPTEALFALDANYIDMAGEDAHGFRALSQRSALPDNIKDAGIAAVLPALTPAWRSAVETTQHLAEISDAERIRRLQPTGVTWVILPAWSTTSFVCPLRNKSASVCRVPAR